MSAEKAKESEQHPLTNIARQALSQTQGDQVSVGDMVRAFGHASFVPLLIIPALLVVSPLGGVPGLSSLFGIIIVLIAGQSLIGRKSIWLPGLLANRSIESDKAASAFKRILPVTRFIDRHSRARLSFLFRDPFLPALPLACVLSGAAMPFLEIVPFASAFLGVAVMLIAYSMLSRDGLFALFALLPLVVAIWVARFIIF